MSSRAAFEIIVVFFLLMIALMITKLGQQLNEIISLVK